MVASAPATIRFPSCGVPQPREVQHPLQLPPALRRHPRSRPLHKVGPIRMLTCSALRCVHLSERFARWRSLHRQLHAHSGYSLDFAHQPSRGAWVPFCPWSFLPTKRPAVPRLLSQKASSPTCTPHRLDECLVGQPRRPCAARPRPRRVGQQSWLLLAHERTDVFHHRGRRFSFRPFAAALPCCIPALQGSRFRRAEGRHR